MRVSSHPIEHKWNVNPGLNMHRLRIRTEIWQQVSTIQLKTASKSNHVNRLLSREGSLIHHLKAKEIRG